MASGPDWQDVGDAKTLAKSPLVQLNARATPIVLSCRDGSFHAISGVCNHAGGRLDDWTMDGDFVRCPWHFTKFHRATGRGDKGHEDDRVPAYSVKVEAGRVLVDLASATASHRSPHFGPPLNRPVDRSKGPIRVVGVSATPPTSKHPGNGSSDALLNVALEHATSLGAVARSVRLRDSRARGGEGHAREPVVPDRWPCSISQMDAADRAERIYEAFVDEADVLVIAAPVHRGSASDLYYRMVDRLRDAQNRHLAGGHMLMRRKVAGFIVTGGRGDVRSVADQMLDGLAELGCQFPAFPYVEHRRGPDEDDEDADERTNGAHRLPVSEDFRDGARGLAARTIDFAKALLASTSTPTT